MQTSTPQRPIPKKFGHPSRRIPTPILNSKFLVRAEDHPMRAVRTPFCGGENRDCALSVVD